MDKTFGFIGAGNMGGALARALRRSLPDARLLISNRSPEKAARLAAELGGAATDNRAVAESADLLFLGVKPQILPELLPELAPALADRKRPPVLVSMAAGTSVERVRTLAGGTYPVIRIMPNTPCAIGEGVILYCCADVPETEEHAFLTAIAGAGRLVPMAEGLFDAAGAVSGCAPAFAAMFLEALADGGVACGLPRAAAMELAAQTLAGTARLYQETAQHPAVLKDAVCSPGGTTIQGVRALERSGFRSAVMEAVISAWEKNRDFIPDSQKTR